MAHNRRGVVRPPVIDGVARQAASSGSSSSDADRAPAAGPFAGADTPVEPTPVIPDSAFAGEGSRHDVLSVSSEPVSPAGGETPIPPPDELLARFRSEERQSEAGSEAAEPTPDFAGGSGIPLGDPETTEPTTPVEPTPMEPTLVEPTAGEPGPAEPAPAMPDEQPRHIEEPRPAGKSAAQPERRRSVAFPAFLSTVLGALLGAALVYGLAYTGYLPNASNRTGVAQQPPAAVNEDLVARIAALESRPAAEAGPDLQAPIEQLNNRVAALESRPQSAATAPGPDLQGPLNDLDARVAALETRPDEAPLPPDLTPIEGRIAALESTSGAVAANGEAITALRNELTQVRDSIQPPPPPVDLGPLQSGLIALGGRVDALGNRATVEDLAVLRNDVVAMRQQLSGLDARLNDLGGRLQESQAGLTTLRTEFDTAQAEAAANPAPDPVTEAGRLAVSLRTAFATGQPYRAPLDELRALLPALAEPPEPIQTRLDEGLKTQPEISAQLQSALPAMLAARPIDPNAGPAAGAMDWMRTVLAVRPTGEGAGEGVDAQIGRLESAVAAEDYSGAAEIMRGLPEPVQAGSGTLVADLMARAAGVTLLADIDTAVAALRMENEE